MLATFRELASTERSWLGGEQWRSRSVLYARNRDVDVAGKMLSAKAERMVRKTERVRPDYVGAVAELGRGSDGP